MLVLLILSSKLSQDQQIELMKGLIYKIRYFIEAPNSWNNYIKIVPRCICRVATWRELEWYLSHCFFPIRYCICPTFSIITFWKTPIFFFLWRRLTCKQHTWAKATVFCWFHPDTSQNIRNYHILHIFLVHSESLSSLENYLKKKCVVLDSNISN